MASMKAEAREPSRATNTVRPPRARAMSAITRASKPSGAPASSSAPGAPETRLMSVGCDRIFALYLDGAETARSSAIRASSNCGGVGDAPRIQL